MRRAPSHKGTRCSSSSRDLLLAERRVFCDGRDSGLDRFLRRERVDAFVENLRLALILGATVEVLHDVAALVEAPRVRIDERPDHLCVVRKRLAENGLRTCG